MFNSKNIPIVLMIFVLYLSAIACKVEKITETPEYKTNISTNMPVITNTITPIVEIETNILYAIVVNVEIGLNIRKYPDSNSEILLTIPNDSKIIVLNRELIENIWIQIQIDSTIGYVNSKYVEIQSK
jgi:hypothetical protein